MLTTSHLSDTIPIREKQTLVNDHTKTGHPVTS